MFWENTVSFYKLVTTTLNSTARLAALMKYARSNLLHANTVVGPPSYGGRAEIDDITQEENHCNHTLY